MSSRSLVRRAGLACLALVFLAAAAAGIGWLRYGEAIGVLQGLVTATADDVPSDVLRDAMTVDGAAAVAHADVYEPAGGARAVMVLVPGLTPAGREDRRIVGVAGVLAGAGFRVVVPDLPGAMTLSAGERDVAVLTVLLRHLAQETVADGLPLGVVAISYGVGPTLAAIVQSERAEAVDLVVGLGGYHDGRTVVSYVTTGSYVDPRDDIARIGTPDPRARWLLLLATADHVVQAVDRATLRELARRGLSTQRPTLADTAQAMAGLSPDAAAVLALVANTEPVRVDALLDAVPPDARGALIALSPSAVDLSALAGRLLLVHGEDDTVIPYSESLRLADAVPGTRVVLVPGFTHVEPGMGGLPGKLAMVRAVAALLDLRR